MMASSLEQRLPEHEIRAAELTLGDWLRVWWGFAWRGIVIIFVASAAGGVMGYVVGVIGTAADVPLAVRFAISGAIGFVVGIVVFTVYLRWLLRARFGSLRVALLRAP